MILLRHLKRVMRRLTPAEVASAELADAMLARLEAQTAQEYASAMVGYHSKRIDRLRGVLAAEKTAAE